MKTNPEFDTTKFVNIDTEPFDIYINGQLVRHLDPGEEQQVVLYVAQVGAKHLVDRILQKQGVKDTLRDTPTRRNAFAKILPDMAVELNIKPLSPDEEKEELKKRLDEQGKKIEEILNSRKPDDDKDKRIKELEEKLELLSKAVLKEEPKGRPPKKQ